MQQNGGRRGSQDLSLSICFVDEHEFNEVSVPNTSRRRRWKENRPSWFHLKDSSEDYSSSEAEKSSSYSEEYEAQSEIGSDDERSENDARVEIKGNSGSDAHESSSCQCPDESSDEGNTRKKKAFSRKQRPKASSLKDTDTKQRKVSNKRLSEEDLEKICGVLEEKREELDRTVTEEIESSANLGFYLSRKALLGNENEHVVSELTGNFIDEFIKITREIFSTRKSTTNKKVPWPTRGQRKLAISETSRAAENYAAIWTVIQKLKFHELTKLQYYPVFMRLSTMPLIH